jgi:hypothetical protein
VASELKHAKMTGWYDPGQLAETAIKVIVSNLLGTRADYRLVESFTGNQESYDYGDQNEIWIDYVADLGDGWDSTFAVARTIAEPSLSLSSPGSSGPHATQRGRILLMGGDEVYPTADREAYQEKLVAPYSAALPQSAPPEPHLYAIPGNHDWYDGLVSFSRLFFQNRWMGGWKTRQRRSYFALRLPHRWWLWGVDVQLESDIDQPQLDYFCEIARVHVEAGDRIILTTAEPDWIYGNIYDPRLQKNLAFLEERVLRNAKAALRVALAGDLHHYRRHEAADDSGKQLITAGGGGAFLHSTYGPPVDTLMVGREKMTEYDLKEEFPTRQTSRKLLFLDLLFPFLNWKFGFLGGFLYLAIAWIYRAPMSEQFSRLAPNPLVRDRFAAFVLGLLASPAGFFWIVALVLGFWAFTDTHKRWYRLLGGGAHALSHLGGIVMSSYVGWKFSLLVADRTISRMLLGAAATFVCGYFVSGFLMGIYLFISLLVFRRHANEAFSALHWRHYKNFIRLHIDSSGTLGIYPIGIRKVPSAGNKHLSIAELAPELIEEPIYVR